MMDLRRADLLPVFRDTLTKGREQKWRVVSGRLRRIPWKDRISQDALRRVLPQPLAESVLRTSNANNALGAVCGQLARLEHRIANTRGEHDAEADAAKEKKTRLEGGDLSVLGKPQEGSSRRSLRCLK